MATYYVGVGGNDANTGLSWAQRFLTLNGAEDEPVAAADIVYVAPGVYRELLTVDVSGTAGNPITYIGDVTGEHTDGIGGVVRITGSDNDTTATRAQCINAASRRNYRTFRGFLMDMPTTQVINIADGNDWIIEDCSFSDSAAQIIYIAGANQDSHTIRRCVFSVIGGGLIQITHSGTLDNIDHLIENCIFQSGPSTQVIRIDRVGGGTIRNCMFMGGSFKGIRVQTALTAAQSWDVNNCIFVAQGTAVQATVAGEIVENYNTFWINSTDRSNVATGGNSLTYPPLMTMPILNSGASQASGFKFPWMFGELSEWSPLKAITGSSEPAADLFGIPRPATAAKNSWGAIQFVDRELESGTVQAGTYGRVIHDAGQTLVRRIPVTAVEITVTLYMRYETDYAGGLPRMVVKQPGQADNIDTMVAAVNTWEQLSVTFTPSATPGFIEVWAESRNTAAATNYDVFYDTLNVS